MTQHQNFEQLTIHRYKLPRPGLRWIAQCLGDVFEHNNQQVPVHRVPFRGGRIIVNELPKDAKASVAVASMHVAGFTYVQEGDYTGVSATFARPVVEGFEVHHVDVGGKTVFEDVTPATGFIALVGADMRSFAVAATYPDKEPESLGRSVAYAVATHGLERAFRCND